MRNNVQGEVDVEVVELRSSGSDAISSISERRNGPPNRCRPGTPGCRRALPVAGSGRRRLCTSPLPLIYKHNHGSNILAGLKNRSAHFAQCEGLRDFTRCSYFSYEHRSNRSTLRLGGSRSCVEPFRHGTFAFARSGSRYWTTAGSRSRESGCGPLMHLSSM